jgi:hypothetical protein
MVYDCARCSRATTASCHARHSGVVEVVYRQWKRIVIVVQRGMTGSEYREGLCRCHFPWHAMMIEGEVGAEVMW